MAAVNEYQQDQAFEEVAGEVDMPTLYEDFAGSGESLDYQEYPAGYPTQDDAKALPNVVRNFIQYFYKNILDRNVYELHAIYDGTFNKITAKFYSRQRWPEAELVAPLVNHDPVFDVLYQELYYRHVYNKLTPTVQDRKNSYNNYAALFNYFMNADGPVDLELPNQWLWDIIDEFIYQYQDYCRWSSRLDRKTDAELAFLRREGSTIWSYNDVLNVLYALVSTSQINEQLQAAKTGGDVAEAAGPFGSRPLYKMLGYFSMIGLLRIHVLLGDYHLALNTMANVELNKKGPYARVTACYVTAYYYVGFCYMALRRYADAIKTFSHVLQFIQRTKQYLTRSYQYDEIVRKSNYMYDMLAMCLTLSPQRVDESILHALRERNDTYQKLTRAPPSEALLLFDELYSRSCPKFVSPLPPDYDSRRSTHLEPMIHQKRIFLNDVRHILTVPNLRSLLKLYTTIGAEKIADLLELGGPVEELTLGRKTKKPALLLNPGAGDAGATGREEEAGDDNDDNADDLVAEHSAAFQEALKAYRALSPEEQRKLALDECHRQLMLFKLKTRQLRWESGDLLQGAYGMALDLDFFLVKDMVHITEIKTPRRVGDWFLRQIGKYNDAIASLQSNMAAGYLATGGVGLVKDGEGRRVGH